MGFKNLLVLISVVFLSVNAFPMGRKNKKKDAPIDTVAFPQGAGSNFVFLDLGDYPNDNSKWATDVKATFVHYNKYRSVAQKRLKDMKNKGQTKLSAMFWYIEDGAKCTYYSHVVCPQKGKVHKDIHENIQNLISDADKAGFDTFIFRFAAQHLADPLAEDYQIHRIDDTWNLIKETYQVVEAAAKGKKIKVLYDLGVETMGHPYSNRSGAQEFLNTIWRRYVAHYPVEKTLGFTLNHAHSKALDNTLRVYESSGKWPAYIGVDIYSDPGKHLGNLASALSKFGRANHPVIIAETYYNSENMARHFRNAKSKLNLQFVLQWPLSENSGSQHATDAETPLVTAYIPNTSNTAVADNGGGIETGGNSNKTRVVWHNEVGVPLEKNKTVAKEIAFKKVVPKSVAVKKSIARKPLKKVAKKVAVKAVPKATIKKVVAKKAVAKAAPKVIAKKVAAKKAVAKKVVAKAPAKKAVVKKVVAKAPAKKATSKVSTNGKSIGTRLMLQ